MSSNFESNYVFISVMLFENVNDFQVEDFIEVTETFNEDGRYNMEKGLQLVIQNINSDGDLEVNLPDSSWEDDELILKSDFPNIKLVKVTHSKTYQKQLPL